jgi:hypothetical protein
MDEPGAGAFARHRTRVVRGHHRGSHGTSVAQPAPLPRGTQRVRIPGIGPRNAAAAGARGRIDLMPATLTSSPETARQALDAWTREVIAWHFDPATGCPFWLDWAAKAGWDPRAEVTGTPTSTSSARSRTSGCGAVRCAAGCLAASPTARCTCSRPAARPGVPKTRINIEDFRIDYSAFSDTLPDAAFPKGADWLSIGPSGPRRLRLAIEHLAQHRGGICFTCRPGSAVGDQAAQARRGPRRRSCTNARHRPGADAAQGARSIQCLFTTPKLLEALCERVSLRRIGIKGVFCGGTEMTPQFHRFAVEEAARRRVLRADVRQHADGPGHAQAAQARGRLGHHLLPALAARHDRSRRPRPARSRGRTTDRRDACG